MATELAAALYNRVLAQQAAHHKHKDICTGPNCFRWTFLIVAALCCVATAFAVALWIRSRQAYQQVIKVRVGAAACGASVCNMLRHSMGLSETWLAPQMFLCH